MPARRTTISKPKAADHPLVSSGAKPRGIIKPSVTKPRAITTLRDHPLVFSDIVPRASTKSSTIIEPRASTKPIATTTSIGKAADHPLTFSTRPSVDKPRAFTTFQDKASDYPLKFPGTKPRGIVKPSIAKASKCKATDYPRKFSSIKPKGVNKSTSRSLASLFGRNDDLYDYLALPTTRPTGATKTSNTPAKPFPYEALPPELRLEILRLTLTDPRVIEIHEYYDDNTLVGRCQKPNTGVYDFLFQDPHLRPSLLRVDKSMYAEARAVLYRDNTFRFSSTPIMERFFTQIGRDNRRGIRRVELVGSILGYRYVSDVAERCAREIAKMEPNHLLLAIGNHWRCNQWYDKYSGIVEDWMPVFKALWLREKRAGETDEVVAERVFGVVKLPDVRAGQCLTSRLHPGGNGNIWSEQCGTCVAEAVRYPESKAHFRELVIEHIRKVALLE